MDASRLGWLELTTEDGDRSAAFWAQVLEARTDPFDMGGYNDHNVGFGDGPAFGVCHPRSGGGHLPPGWMPYWLVPEMDAALERVREAGGTVRHGPSEAKGHGRYAFVADPGGRVAALFEAT